MSFDTSNYELRHSKPHAGKTVLRAFDSSGALVGKSCRQCDDMKPVTDFYKNRNRNATRDGYAQKCKVCQSKYASEYRRKRRADDPAYYRKTHSTQFERLNARSESEVLADRARLRPNGTKRCVLCKGIKPLSNFSPVKRYADGLAARCNTCHAQIERNRRNNVFLNYYEAHGLELECYLCGGPYEETEHLIPRSKGGAFGPENTRPSCIQCNRGTGGKAGRPLEDYIFKVNHPTKTRAKILFEIVSSGTWPFAKTTPQEFVKQCKEANEQL